jgi:two-component system sensor histidine kinase PilS (NtrC family)
LGLPVVHRAVEAHHGLVLVDALARGTCFTLLLPVDAAGRAAADGGAEPLALVAGHG